MVSCARQFLMLTFVHADFIVASRPSSSTKLNVGVYFQQFVISAIVSKVNFFRMEGLVQYYKMPYFYKIFIYIKFDENTKSTVCGSRTHLGTHPPAEESAGKVQFTVYLKC